MTAVDEATRQSDHPASRVTRGSRRWPWGVAAVLIIALASAGGFLIWAAHYQPLSTGGLHSEFGSPAPPQLGAPTTQYSLDAVKYQTTWVVYPRKVGEKFGFVYGLHNSGRYGVTVLNIGFPPSGMTSSPDAEFAIAAMRRNRPAWLSNSPDYNAPYYMQRFTPVLLSPRGPEFDMGTTWTYRGCPKGKVDVPSGYATSTDKFAVTYRFLWFTHTVLIPLQNSLYIANIPRCHTP
jgi:hypothetical protein